MVTKEQIDEVVKRIRDSYHPEKIILFGSYAYGNPTEESDLDILIIKETALPRYRRGREVRRCLRGLKTPVDLIVYSKKEIEEWLNVNTAFITTVMEKGKVLYG
jgi:uncharacterized protein